MMKPYKPTNSELEILQVLWDQGPSSVRIVNEELNKKKDSGYTTTLKLMQIMTEKGLTSRDTSARTHIYTALASEHKTKSNLLQRFVSTTFKGSAGKLVMSALGSGAASQEELADIKALIAKLEDKS